MRIGSRLGGVVVGAILAAATATGAAKASERQAASQPVRLGGTVDQSEENATTASTYRPSLAAN